MVKNRLSFVRVEGPRGSATFCLRALRERMTGLYVSLEKKVITIDRMAKNIKVHCVQRQDNLTVTMEPITGLPQISANIPLRV